MLKHQEDQLILAKEMADDFANIRGNELAEEFFRSSGLFDEFYKEEFKFKFLMADYAESFKAYLALAYGLGMMDGFQNVAKNTYKQKTNTSPADTQLSLPGLD